MWAKKEMVQALDGAELKSLLRLVHSYRMAFSVIEEDGAAAVAVATRDQGS
jgi:hypothetical protein